MDVFNGNRLAQPRWVRGWLSPGKSATVKEAAFAVATLCEPLEWGRVDGPEEVALIFLLAILPAAGSTHIEVLTALTSRPADDDQGPRNGGDHGRRCADRAGRRTWNRPTPSRECPDYLRYRLPGRIAHTYGRCGKAGRRMGVNVVVETGANGIEDASRRSNCRRPEHVSFAAEVAIKESERFAGIPTVSVPVAEPLRHAEALIERALALKPADAARHAPVDTETKRVSKPSSSRRS